MKLKFLALAGAAIAALSAAPAQAEWAPSEPIKFIVPYGAGGSTDVFGRVFAAEMESQTGWRVLIENRPGAGGAVGSIETMNAKPDGHTLGLSATGLFAIQPFMPDGTPELQPENMDYMGTLSVIPFAIITGADSPFDDLKSLAEYSKTNGPAKFSSTSKPLAYAMDIVAEELGINMVAAATSGSAESLQLVLGGHADFTISGGVHVPYVVDKRMKVLAHIGARGSYAPDVGTVEDQDATFPLSNHFMFSAPKGLPADARAALAKAIDNAVNSDAVRAHANKLHVAPENLGPDGSSADVMKQAKFWRAFFEKN
jgi:tripartite-type tricarboxylate transporter receptor subunit TctC